MAFTLKDLPLINRHGLRRWDIIDDKIKEQVKIVIADGMVNGNPKEKIMAASLALRVDALNLKHEAMYVPKADMDLSTLTDEQLQSLISDMTTKLPEMEVLKMLKHVDPSECVISPMYEADDHEWANKMRDGVTIKKGVHASHSH